MISSDFKRIVVVAAVVAATIAAIAAIVATVVVAIVATIVATIVVAAEAPRMLNFNQLDAYKVLVHKSEITHLHLIMLKL